MNLFGFSRKNSSQPEEEKEKDTPGREGGGVGSGPDNSLTFLTKLTRFFTKKATVEDNSPKTVISPILKRSPSQNEKSLERKESLSLRETPRRKETLRMEKENTTDIQNKVIYEVENEKDDEFEKEVFQDQMDFENKLRRYQYYEHLKEVLNNQEEEENLGALNINTDDEEEEIDRNFRNEGIVQYEKEYQKLANSLGETGGSLYTEKKNAFELIEMYSDAYPVLALRKKILYIMRFLIFFFFLALIFFFFFFWS